ncbi:DUF302 domain-containing protein [Gudongella sp. DL1XJH-153]|uniref:DUF302 domain-containing protein n=1 Tax=Gudongella sp. DL1XJH-153 TaxID=3409804 RepID=UPI003BB5D0DE
MNIHYTVTTEKSFEEALNALKKSLKERSFGVLWELDFEETLKGKGLDFEGNMKILEVCNPKQAKEILEINMESGIFLPCKMAVYEDKGSVIIGLIKPSELMNVFDDSKLSEIALTIEEGLMAAMDQAK